MHTNLMRTKQGIKSVGLFFFFFFGKIAIVQTNDLSLYLKGK